MPLPRPTAALGIALAVLTAPTTGEARDRSVRADFQRLHPCPANGHRTGPCPGYVVDHIRPLCAGGPDSITNMQWQTIEAARIKDREEARECARLRNRR